MIVAGPTASGKSLLALEVSKKTGALLINADSMQMYKDLPILTAHPSQDDLQQHPHVLYGILDAAEDSSVAVWQKHVIDLLTSTPSSDYPFALIVGGTGLYLKSITHGLSCIPTVSADIRQTVHALSMRMTRDEFQRFVLTQDPELAQCSPPCDPQRLIRALEVKLYTGKSIRSYQNQATPPLRPPLFFGILEPDRDMLHQKINQRVHHMIKQGVLDEITTFLSKNPPKNALLWQAIGLNSFCDHIQGTLSRQQAVDAVQQKTRQYAKRQYTWFKNQVPPNVVRNPTIEHILHACSHL
jgi:tRNA dimethylallyltransferase